MGQSKTYYVYIMGSISGTLYTGLTSKLDTRVKQHKAGRFEGFSKDYKTHRLLYFERYAEVGKAIAREKQIKRWRREKKVALIQSVNPSWVDLSSDRVKRVLVVKKIEPD